VGERKRNCDVDRTDRRELAGEGVDGIQLGASEEFCKHGDKSSIKVGNFLISLTAENSIAYFVQNAVIRHYVLKKICGGERKVTGGWRKLHYEQLHDLYFFFSLAQQS
jgi:hypothetical protein